jgi:hypothetical protein
MGQALGSQTDQDFESVVADDGSTIERELGHGISTRKLVSTD